MKAKWLSAALICSTAPMLIASLANKIVVDATVPVRARLREPTSGRVGMDSRKLPIRVVIAIQDPIASEGEKSRVEFTLTNSGSEPIELPISPHPRDLEPTTPKDYRLSVLELSLTSATPTIRVLPGGAILYGSPEHPDSLIQLAPGQSMQVLALVKLATHGAPTKSEVQAPATLAAHVALEEQKVTTRDGKPYADSQVVGTAESPTLPVPQP